MLKRKIPLGSEPAPLDDEECRRIWAWERGMMAFYLGAMIAIVILIWLASVYGGTSGGRFGIVAGILAVAGIGAFVQFREKCPRCHARLGRQSRLMLPQKCASCGVEFPRQPN